MQKQTKYNDVKFFLPAIAFISAFNYYLTYSNIRLNWYLALTYSIDTVEGWLAWYVVRSIIIYLDKKMPYGNRPFKRILVQVVITTIAGLLVIILATELVSWFVRGRPAIVSFYLYDIFIIAIWFLVINGIYIAMHFYSEWKASEHRRLEEKKIRNAGFAVKHGKQNLLIPFHEIAGFSTENGYSILLNWQNKKFFPDKSLDKIEELLPEEWFFRLNRQYIIHRNSITGFKRLNNGKIDVLIKPFENIPPSIQLSRLRAPAFKNWVEPKQT